MNRVAPGQFDIVSGESDLGQYKFNTQAATHYFCKKCGIQMFHNPRSAPEIWSVNIRCIDEIDLDGLVTNQVFGSKLK